MILPTLRHTLASGLAAGSLFFAPLTLADDQRVSLKVPYVPTPQIVVDRMLEMARVQAGDRLIDLGSGDGRIAISAARLGADAMGVDLNPERVAEAQANARAAGLEDKVSFVEQNLYDTSIAEADVITMYLLPSVNLELRPRLFKELRPGTRIVSHAFDMGDWLPDQRDLADGRAVYLWYIPAQVAGSWQVSAPTPFKLELRQKHQMLEGHATIEGRQVPISNARVQGNDIFFTLQDTEYQGTLQNGVLAGKDGHWHATTR